MGNRIIRFFVAGLMCLSIFVALPQGITVQAASVQNVGAEVAAFSYNSGEYFFSEGAPGAFPYGPTKRFEGFFNRHFITTHTPHHRGYDRIYQTGERQTIEGKFMYGDIRKDMGEEWISIYVWRHKTRQWELLSRQKTDKDGRISYTLRGDQMVGVGTHPVKMVVEGDNSFANMYLQVLNEHEKYVVFDIDATLTQSDGEVTWEVIDNFFFEAYQAKPISYSKEVVQYYKDQGYKIVYVTARPYWLGDLSSKWLIDKGYPMGIVHTTEKSDKGKGHDRYKADYLKSIIARGAVVEYGYGNATTDFNAYREVGIPLDSIFLIGKNAGYKGSTPINNYYDHLKILQDK